MNEYTRTTGNNLQHIQTRLDEQSFVVFFIDIFIGDCDHLQILVLLLRLILLHGLAEIGLVMSPYI